MFNSNSLLCYVIRSLANCMSVKKHNISVKLLENAIQKAHNGLYSKSKCVGFLNESIVV